MKKLLKSIRRSAKGLVAITGLAVGLAACCDTAQAQQTRWGNFTNCSSLMMAANTASNINAQITLYRDRGIAILPKMAGTNAATASVVFTFQVSADGTNWSTTTPQTYSLALNGTTAVVGYTNILRDALDNVRWLRLATITNGHTASIWISNVVWSAFP